MTPPKPTATGCGYPGTVHAAAMTHLGHHVLGVDTRPEQVEALSQGRVPFYEPELPELLVTGARQGDLRSISTLTPAELAEADVHFIAVGTPQSTTGGEVDLNQLWSMVNMLHDTLSQGGRNLVMGKSTVPVGAIQQVAERLTGRALVLWNPEFLREGFTVADTPHPDRIVYGVPIDPVDAQGAQAMLSAVYQDLLKEDIPRIVTDHSTAELARTVTNSFLATKISFINTMARLCDAAGADVIVLTDAIGHDLRIGRRFLQAGAGFGGGCLPKDIRALRASANLHGAVYLADLLGRVGSINRKQHDRIVELACAYAGDDLPGRAITILRAAFKPLNNGVHDSPALDIISRLVDLGAKVIVCDLQALLVVARSHPHLTLKNDPRATPKGAEFVLLLTEWDQFVVLDPAEAATGVIERVTIGGRNALDPVVWCEAGWTYAGAER